MCCLALSRIDKEGNEHLEFDETIANQMINDVIKTSGIWKKMTAHAKANGDEELLREAYMYTQEQLYELSDEPYDALGLDYEQLLEEFKENLTATDEQSEEGEVEEGWHSEKFQRSVDYLLKTGLPLFTIIFNTKF